MRYSEESEVAFARSRALKGGHCRLRYTYSGFAEERRRHCALCTGVYYTSAHVRKVCNGPKAIQARSHGSLNASADIKLVQSAEDQIPDRALKLGVSALH